MLFRSARVQRDEAVAGAGRRVGDPAGDEPEPRGQPAVAGDPVAELDQFGAALDAGERRAKLISNGTPVEIGSIEKMSKSKRNTIDPDDIIGSYGADTARWFMLSDSPPERDVIWTEEGVQGAARFIQRLWRLVGDVADLHPSENAHDAAAEDAVITIRKAAHRAIIRVEEDLERLRFNRCVAHAYELANALQAELAVKKDKKVSPQWIAALREASAFLIAIIAPMMPHLAEECWAALGHSTLIAEET